MIAVAVILAGALGAVCRFVVDGAVKGLRASTFPWGTFVINVSGSLLLGILAGLVISHGMPSSVQAVVGTGFCGGYTTFSTASFETIRLAQGRQAVLSALNAIGSLVCSVGACALGLVLAWAI